MSLNATRAVAALVLLLIVTGCKTTEKAPDVNLAGYPPEFRAGYLDGCETARHPSTERKDLPRMKSEPTYAAGWRDGFDICNNRKRK